MVDYVSIVTGPQEHSRLPLPPVVIFLLSPYVDRKDKGQGSESSFYRRSSAKGFTFSVTFYRSQNMFFRSPTIVLESKILKDSRRCTVDFLRDSSIMDFKKYGIEIFISRR